jgi:hypothetical protein
MNTKTRTFSLLLVTAVILALAYADARAQGPDHQLVGSWTATFTPIPGDPVQFAPIPALFTFTSDGTLVETDGGGLQPSPDLKMFGSPGHGVWRKLKDHTYEFKNVIIVINAVDATLFLTITVHMTVVLDKSGDKFKGNGTFKVVDTNGAVLIEGPENISGTRIEIK